MLGSAVVLGKAVGLGARVPVDVAAGIGVESRVARVGRIVACGAVSTTASGVICGAGSSPSRTLASVRTVGLARILTPRSPRISSVTPVQCRIRVRFIMRFLRLLRHKHNRQWHQHTSMPETFDLNAAEADCPTRDASQLAEQRAIMEWG